VSFEILGAGNRDDWSREERGQTDHRRRSDAIDAKYTHKHPVDCNKGKRPHE
jgi:hypothetical protein